MDSKGKKSLLDVPGYVYFSWFSGAFDLCHVHEMSITCKLVDTHTHIQHTVGRRTDGLQLRLQGKY